MYGRNLRNRFDMWIVVGAGVAVGVDVVSWLVGAEKVNGAVLGIQVKIEEAIVRDGDKREMSVGGI